jgi:hypothetical protein
MNPGGLRSNLGVMARTGDAVYLPLRRGRNRIVFAVIECTGGWAFSARLDGSAGVSSRAEGGETSSVPTTASR